MENPQVRQGKTAVPVPAVDSVCVDVRVEDLLLNNTHHLQTRPHERRAKKSPIEMSNSMGVQGTEKNCVQLEDKNMF